MRKIPTFFRTLFAVLLVLGTAESTLASQFPPVEFKLDGEARAAEAGQPFTATLIIRAAMSCQLERVSLNGDGWQVQAPRLLSTYDLAPGDEIRIDFTATPSDPNHALILRFTHQGESVVRKFDLSPAHIRGLTNPRINYWPPGVDPAFNEPLVLEEAPPPVSVTSEEGSRDMTISGHLVYTYEPNGVVVPLSYTSYALKFRYSSTLIYVGTTDANGDFQLTLPVLSPMFEYEVRVYATNNRVRMEESDFLETNWSFRVGTFEYNGQDLDFGTRGPGSSNSNAAFHFASTIKRGGDFLEYDQGYDLDRIECIWPGGYGTYYNPFWVEIHIGGEDKWNEADALHEYGHYWGYHAVNTPSMSYDNGICDDQSFWEGLIISGGHCMWCEESSAVAWNEGIANFISRICTDNINFSFPNLPGGCNQQEIQNIDDEYCPGQNRPDWTEGFVAAMFYDFWDRYDTGENDLEPAEFVDVAEGWGDALFNVLTDPCETYGERPNSAASFLICFNEHYPGLEDEIWEVAKNCGFDYDTAAPHSATNLTCSPVVGNPSPDNTINLAWDRAYDNWSGISGYSVTVTSSPSIPEATANIGDVTAWTSPPVEPGSHYINLRARDNAGHWSSTYATIGPVIILEPDPADLQPVIGTGWDWPLVPRNSDDATSNDCTVTGNLPGGGDTWWNLRYLNSGTTSTGQTTIAGLYFDSLRFSEANVLTLGGGIGSRILNEGPIAIPGGRHTLRTQMDDDEVLAEPNEANNFWAGQWVWSPPIIEDTFYPWPNVPWNLADGEYYHWQEPYYMNCAGFEMPMQLLAYGATMYTDDPEKDYDLKLFSSFNTATLGFDTALATSNRAPGMLDAVIVNPVVAGYSDYNIGVYTPDPGFHTGFFLSRQAASSLGSVYGTESLSLDELAPMNMFAFIPPGSSNGAVTFRLTVDLDSPPLHMGYFPPEFGVGGLLDASQIVTATADSPGQIMLEQSTSANGLIVVWREPGVGDMTEGANATLEYEQTLPDLQPNFAENWHGPLVPQPDTSIAYPYPSMPAPALLPGGAPYTYLYFSYLNDSTAPTFVPALEFQLDGELLTYTSQGSELPAHTARSGRLYSPMTIPGGRHTLGYFVDRGDQITEDDETNNGYAFQWVWSPPSVDFLGTAQLLTDIPYVFGGWDVLDVNSPRYANVMGLRTDNLQQVADSFAGIIICPDDTSAVDMKIYTPMVSATEGFEYPIVTSNSFVGEANFIVFDVEELNDAEYLDFGTSHWEGRNEAVYQLEIGHWLTAPADPDGVHGPYLLAENDMLDIHTLLRPGPSLIRISLIPESPTDVDLGLTMHQGAFSSKVDGLGLGGSYEAENQHEEFLVDLPSGETFFSLAVWRRKLEGLETPVSYYISISSDLTPVEDMPQIVPRVTSLGKPVPNPFNPQTRISFDLAREDLVRIQVHDLGGRPVRTLVSQRMQAGSHSVIWDGRSDSGRPMASGVYFARMVAGTAEEMVKLTLIK